MLTRQEVFNGYQLLLGRMPEDEFTITLHQGHGCIADFVTCLMDCQEFRDKAARRLTDGPPPSLPPIARTGRIPSQLGSAYLAPTDLRPPPLRGHRVLLIGQCMFDTWPRVIYAADPETEVERILYNNLSVLPAAPLRPWSDYDFQLVQPPLRSILPEWDYLPLAYGDLEAYERLFATTVERLSLHLDNALAWTDHLPAFVMSYMRPQQNLMGRLQPRYDLRNPVYFIEKLNEALSAELQSRRQAYLLDIDGVAGVLGRRFIQDDVLSVQSHGSLLGDFDYPLDQNRLLATEPASALFDLDTDSFIGAVWAEAKATYATLTSAHPVKMVCVDLDDTLWRGVLAEQESIDGFAVEGWPLGVIEALAYLKKRGVLLAIVSKNDEARIRQLWPQVIGARLSLDDFAILKINWRPKSDNVAEAIAEANILPSSVVFLDDNPTERALVKAALPDVRVVEAPHYYWRRVLLWSAETQVATVSEESGRRTQMIQAQIARERSRAGLSRDTFLADLGLQVSLHRVGETLGRRFERAFELLNKSNQFNTTGERWDLHQADAYFSTGGVWWTFDVLDRFTNYGLVGVVALRGARFDQVVMSCRVFGLEIEMAVLAALQAEWVEGALSAVIRATSANRLALDLYQRCGWRLDGELWLNGRPPAAPSHVRILLSEAPPPAPLSAPPGAEVLT